MRAKFEFDGSNRGVPWYKQALPLASIENDHAKIVWDIPIHLDKRTSNNAIKPDMLISFFQGHDNQLRGNHDASFFGNEPFPITVILLTFAMQYDVLGSFLRTIY